MRLTIQDQLTPGGTPIAAGLTPAPSGAWKLPFAPRPGRATSRTAERAVPLLGSLILAAIGLSALTGWVTGSHYLSAVRPGYIPVAPNTALVFLALAAALVALQYPSRATMLFARSSAAFALVVAGARLAEYLVGTDLGVDRWIFSFPSESLGLAPVGKMAFYTAVCFVLGASALLASTFPRRRAAVDDLTRASALLVTMVAAVFLLGYAYGSPLLYGGRAIPMAMLTALGFVALGLSLAVPAALRDADRRRAAREALQTSHDELERRVAARTVELAAANAELRDAVVRLEQQTDELERQSEEAQCLAEQVEATNQELHLALAETERAGKALAAERHFLRQVIDTIPHFVFARDRAGRFTLVNQAAAEAFGAAPEAMLGRTAAEVNPNVREASGVREDDLAVMASLAPKLIPEEVITDASGAVRYLQTVKRPLVGDDGRAEQVLSVSTDITERRWLNEQLLQAQKMEAVGQLAGGVAHDFNNLLTVITSYSALLLADLPKGDTRREDLMEIQQAGDRAAGLTRQLLAFSRKQVLQPQALDLRAVVASTEKMLRRLIGADIDLVTVHGADLGLVHADAGQIEQVIVNLAVNARDAMPGGGRLTIETANVELAQDVASRRLGAKPGAYVMLAVSDTGGGIPSDALPHIFEPFFTTKDRGKGTGLGLATVHGIVKQSGGDIWLYSEPGEGTTFKVYLPRMEGDAAAVTREAARSAVPRGTETVLLVEDDTALRQLARRVLAGQGYVVVEAANGQQALEACAGYAGRIDLVLTDVVMPGLGGRAVAERLTELWPSVRLLYMSGYTDDDVVRRGVLDTRAAFLQKPFTPELLARKVREVLDER